MKKATMIMGLAALAACGDDGGEGDPDASGGVCGDGVVDVGEVCDDGELNGPGANCFEDCTANTTQKATGSAEEVLERIDLDAAGVEDEDAPAGTGAWTPSGEGASAKFNINIPMYDFYDEVDPALLAEAPWLPPREWLGGIRISDVEEISFWTKTPAEENGTPFFLVLYTEPDGVDDHAGWYGHRLTGRKTATATDVDEGGAWVKWTVSDAEKQLAFVDQPVTGTFSGSGLPTLPELVADESFDWSQVNEAWPETSLDYGAEVLRYISLQTSSGTETTESSSMLDLIEIRLTDGRRVELDLEP